MNKGYLISPDLLRRLKTLLAASEDRTGTALRTNTIATRAKDFGFWAKIGQSVNVSPNKWRYSFVEVEKTGCGYGQWTEKTDGITGSIISGNTAAYNTFEDVNEDTGIIAAGIDTENIPDGFALKPIGVGAIVRMYQVWNTTFDSSSSSSSSSSQFDIPTQCEYWFSAPNQPDGNCSDLE